MRVRACATIRVNTVPGRSLREKSPLHAAGAVPQTSPLPVPENNPRLSSWIMPRVLTKGNSAGRRVVIVTHRKKYLVAPKRFTRHQVHKDNVGCLQKWSGHIKPHKGGTVSHAQPRLRERREAFAKKQ